MGLATGGRVGAYEIVGLLGAGGMGEVYRARDIRLQRDVAIKILPALFALDPERRARFEREAQVLASLNHPHIAAIYGFEESHSTGAIVMELVEGPTLADRLARGPVPIGEALAIAKQIVLALDAAHEKGVVHRDLKPANIKLTADGTVKVLDFGLAKALSGDGAPPAAVTQSPTLSAVGTRAGVILGTAAYMSPEQARGQSVDKRADIWAFGCVLYELLTGRKAHHGPTVSDVVVSILTREVDWAALPSDTPDSTRRLLRRCLEKDPKQRLRDVGDARFELEDAAPGGAATSATRSERGWQRLLTISTATFMLIAAALLFDRVRTAPSDTASELRLDIATPPTSEPVSIAISPDGSRVIYAASLDGPSRLWLRRLDSAVARALPGTEGGTFPFWSPDGKSIGFFADRRLKRLDIESGTPQTLAVAHGGRGGAWSADGTIVFQPVPSSDAPLHRIAAAGGSAAALPHRGRFPQFLPDGDQFLYFTAGPERRGIYVASLKSGSARWLLHTAGAAVHASGFLLFVREGTLVGQALDMSSLTLEGDAFTVAEQVLVNGPLQTAPLSAAAGRVLYRSGAAGGQRQAIWYHRSGREIQRVGEPGPMLISPTLAPDGRRIGMHGSVNGIFGIWTLDLQRGVVTRVGGADLSGRSHPLWSPSGDRLVFEFSGTMHEQRLASPAAEQLLPRTAGISRWPTDWSNDGRLLLFNEHHPKTGRDIWMLPMKHDGERQPAPIVRTDFDEEDAQFSSDGRWIAFQSDVSGRTEVYVQPFPGPGSRVQVSTNGGAQPRWRRDGGELFYVSLDGRLMAAPIRVTGNGILEADPPIALFPARVGGALQSNSRQQYIVSPDGQRFLLNTLTEEAAAPITVIVNWSAGRTARRN